MNKEPKNQLKFANIPIDDSQIFYKRKFVFAFTNLRPIVPGHILLCPTREEKKYSDLTETEVMELWISAKNIIQNLKKYYGTDSVQVSIQDGEDAGQTVEHCHIHIIPIPSGYNAQTIDDSSRKPRTKEEMAQEAEDYRNNFVFN